MDNFVILYISLNGYSYTIVNRELKVCEELSELKYFINDKIDCYPLSLKGLFNLQEKTDFENYIYVNKVENLTNLQEFWKIKEIEIPGLIDCAIVLKSLINDEILSITDNMKQKLNKFDADKPLPMDIAPLFTFAAGYEQINNGFSWIDV